MNGRSIWETLGVAEDAERTEIRRAYAARLKLTNPEDDAEGFQALRQAYEAALNIAEHRARVTAMREAQAAQEAAAGPDAADVPPSAPQGEAETARRRAELDIIAQRARSASGQAEPETAPGPEAPPPSEEEQLRRQNLELMAGHAEACNRLGAMIASGAPAEEQLAAFDAIMASQAMAAISAHADTEAWLAHALLGAGPNSDALMLRAIERFGWRERAGGWDLPRAVAELLMRARVAEVAVQLNRPDNFSYHAYQALLRPPRELSAWRRWRLGRHGDRVEELLRRLRNNYPEMLGRLDPEAIMWWDQRLSKKTPLWVWITRVLAVIVFISWITQLAGMPDVKGPPDVNDLRSRAASHPEDTVNLVELCRQRGRQNLDLQPAIHDCQTAVDDSKMSILALEAKALVNLRLARMQEARSDYDALLALSPNNARGLYGRGLVRRADNDPGASEDFQKALIIDPDVGSDFYKNGFAMPSNDTMTEDQRALLVPTAVPPAEKISTRRGAVIDWPKELSKPGRDVLERAYPPMASSQQVEAHVLMHCKVRLDGRPSDCIVWSETPQDQGFGDGALLLADFFKFSPLMIDGRPDPRGTVNIPIHFNPG